MKFTDQIINVGYKVLLFVYIVFTCADEIMPVPKDLCGGRCTGQTRLLQCP